MRALSVLLLAALAQSSANPIFAPPARVPKHLTLMASASARVAKAGARVTLFVDVRPNARIHVYAPGAKDYRPIAMSLDGSSAFAAGKTRYPPSELWRFEPLKERVPVFQQPFRLSRELTLARTVKVGTTLTVTGTVTYQACDDKVCYRPESVPVSWILRVD